MRLTTRLLLPLLATVAVVMMLFAIWALRQREASTTNEAQRVTAAYATALALGLEGAFRAGSAEHVQAAIDLISREPTIFGVIVYGEDTRVMFTSQPVGDIETAPLAAVRRVIATQQTTSFTREIDGQRVYSILRPLSTRYGEMVGAMEVVQPWEYVQAELRRTRQRFILNILTLLLAVTLVIMLLVGRLIAKPLNRFVEAVQALGRGELGYRATEERTGAELTGLAREFLRSNSAVRIRIEGHADERGLVEYNLALSMRRANAVRDYLAGFGVDASRLDVQSVGEDRPMTTGATESAWGSEPARRVPRHGRSRPLDTAVCRICCSPEYPGLSGSAEKAEVAGRSRRLPPPKGGST